MSKNTNQTTYSGLPLMLLTITLVVLKALGYLNWSWWWVFSPLWIPFAILILVFIVGVIWIWFTQ